MLLNSFHETLTVDNPFFEEEEFKRMVTILSTDNVFGEWLFPILYCQEHSYGLKVTTLYFADDQPSGMTELIVDSQEYISATAYGGTNPVCHLRLLYSETHYDLFTSLNKMITD